MPGSTQNEKKNEIFGKIYVKSSASLLFMYASIVCRCSVDQGVQNRSR